MIISLHAVRPIRFYLDQLAGNYKHQLEMTFISDPGQLQAGLFAPYQSRYGAQTLLNVNYIPDLLQHIKRQLTSEELIRLEDYHLQNYLMELSINYKDTKSLSALTDTVLAHIRSNNNFWYRHNNQEQLDQQQQLKHHAIVCYHKDIECLRQAFSNNHQQYPFVPTYNRKTTQGFQFHLLHQHSEPYFGTRQPFNHIAYIPQFLMQKYRQSYPRNSLKNQQAMDKQEQVQAKQRQVSELSPDTQQQLKSIMEQCISFLISNKSRHKGRVQLSPKDNSNQIEEQKEKSSDESGNHEQISQQPTILDEFLSFVQRFPSVPKFPSSHHMQFLTLNLINSCQQVLKMYGQPHSPSQAQRDSTSLANMNQQKGPSIQTIDLDGKFVETLSIISEKALSQPELDIVGAEFLKHWRKDLKFITRQMRRRELESLHQKGWLNTPQQIYMVKESYQNMLDHPQFVELTKYRAKGTGIPWKQADYLKFLEGLKEFLNIPTNNKKIACSMGAGYEPNHVKHVKGVYLTVMKERMERGECGGGKRGKSLSKSDFIQKDIHTFSMKWFQKTKKNKNRKPKRKRKNSGSSDGEEQPDSEY